MINIFFKKKNINEKRVKEAKYFNFNLSCYNCIYKTNNEGDKN